jgi:hypothetical protein
LTKVFAAIITDSQLLLLLPQASDSCFCHK